MNYYIDPFGCVKNQVDAEKLMSALNSAGWVYCEEAENADIIIVNSCAFINSAKQESINAVLEWKKLFPKKKIVLTGCLAVRYEKELKENLPEAIVAARLPDDLSCLKLLKQKTKIACTHINEGDRPLLSFPGQAYVKISEGCNNYCSYCAIPLIKGNLISRPINKIVDECKTLLKRGIKELNIVGQDIGAYGVDFSKSSSAPCSQLPTPSQKLPDLLTAISKIKQQDFWVRLLYIHPDHFPYQILDIMEKDSRFLPYFDIPFQHASKTVLQNMNRKGNKEQYLNLIRSIRARFPDKNGKSRAIIRTTFLLGFPGETEEDFEELLDFQKKAEFDWLGCFAYSREEGTAAFSMKKQVPKKTALMRKKIIEDRQTLITEKAIKRFVGCKLSMLIEEKIEGDNQTYFIGRLYCQAPDIDGASVLAENDNTAIKPGILVPCKVIARRGFDLEVCLNL